MKKHIPNFITILNLCCGFGSVMFLLGGYPVEAAYLIFIAAVFDFLDGGAARLLNAYSEIGKQLDSLSDMVSFGLAPALLYSVFAGHSIQQNFYRNGFGGMTLVETVIVFSPVLLVVAAAIRLARFNTDEGQEKVFSGLPTPAAGLFFASLSLSTDMFLPSALLLALPVLFAILMVSDLPMYSLKFDSIRDTSFFIALFMAIAAVVTVLVFSVKYIFLIIILYIFTALVLPVFVKTKP